MEGGAAARELARALAALGGTDAVAHPLLQCTLYQRGVLGGFAPVYVQGTRRGLELSRSAVSVGREEPRVLGKGRAVSGAAAGSAPVSSERMWPIELRFEHEGGARRRGWRSGSVATETLYAKDEEHAREFVEFVMQPAQPIGMSYDLQAAQVVGEGAFGTVLHVPRRRGGRGAVALKVVDRTRLSAPERLLLRRELLALHAATDGGVPCMCELIEAFETEDKTFMVLTLFAGGEVHRRLAGRPAARAYTEMHVAAVMRATLRSLAGLHEIGIAHRDLKAENVMFEESYDSDSDDGQGALVAASGDGSWAGSARLCDLGLAAFMGEAVPAAGSLAYMAPEVVSAHVDESDVVVDASHDVWSAGAIAYLLLTGEQPFERGSTRETIQAVLDHQPPLLATPGAAVSTRLSADCVSLLALMLERDPAQRITAEEALAHPWLQKKGTCSAPLRSAHAALRVYLAAGKDQRGVVTMRFGEAAAVCGAPAQGNRAADGETEDKGGGGAHGMGLVRSGSAVLLGAVLGALGMIGRRK